MPVASVAPVFTQAALDWLVRLIAFDTTSRHSNLALIKHVQAYLHTLNLQPWLSFNADDSKANLFVTIANVKSTEKDSKQGGIVLSGHTDVVPVDGQNWLTDPFTANVKADKVFGRGTADMKGFIACVLSVVPHAVQLAKQNRLKYPVHLALSFDEEVGCLGAPVMLAELQKRGIAPEHCIVGEPTGMKMVIAHKGVQVYRCCVHGQSAHSSLTPQGVNAIEYAAKLIGFINQLADKLAQRQDTDPAFDVPFATLSVNRIQGGSADNIVPNFCEFTFDYRNLPHMNTQTILEPIQAFIKNELLPTMRTVSSHSHIDIQQMENVPAMTSANSAELQGLIATLVDDTVRHKVAYATEGGQFTQAGIATVICGPGHIAQAHKANEYVEISQLERCLQFLLDLLG